MMKVPYGIIIAGVIFPLFLVGIIGWFIYADEQRFIKTCKEAGGFPVIADNKVCFTINAILELK